MYEGTTQDPSRWDGSRPGMDNDKTNGERKICLRQASGMESTAAEGTTQLAATATATPDPPIPQAAVASTEAATAEPTTATTAISAAATSK